MDAEISLLYLETYNHSNIDKFGWQFSYQGYKWHLPKSHFKNPHFLQQINWKNFWESFTQNSSTSHA